MSATAIQAVVGQLEERIGAGRVTIDAPLGPLTTFKVGGAADLLVEAKSEDELVAAAEIAREAGLSVTPLGGGFERPRRRRRHSRAGRAGPRSPHRP